MRRSIRTAVLVISIDEPRGHWVIHVLGFRLGHVCVLLLLRWSLIILTIDLKLPETAQNYTRRDECPGLGTPVADVAIEVFSTEYSTANLCARN